MARIEALNPFLLTFYKVSIENWSVKKKQLMDLINWDEKECWTDECFTDYYKNIRRQDKRAPYTDQFIDILKPELNGFVNKVQHTPINRYNFDLGMKINNLWAQRYSTQHFMPPHTHEPSGFSAVLYAEFDKREHQATKFWAPFKNTVDAMDYRYDPQVNEGDILFFPSFLIHYAEPNKSTKQRTIFSFNSFLRPTGAIDI